MLDIQELISELMDDYGDYLKKTAYIMVRDAQIAEDLVQETFFSFYKSHHRFRRESSYKTYLYRILMNHVKMHLRKKKDILLEYSDDLNQVVTFESRLVGLMDLHDAIEGLGIKYSQVIVLYYFNEMKIEEIAKVLNVSNSAVKMRLKRAKDALETDLERRESHGKMATVNE